ncbi:MAG TPA: T9SS type A sorting domain-containing protein, partial [Ignavibacteria bacterium]|nr:T9SS type A sorting domain-containing protein [Ignavibacteria bacterium]
ITFVQGSGSYLCSGSLVNNALQDRTLYYLTAEHCSPDNHSSMVFYFNYESPTCYGSSGVLNQSLSGATLKASNYATDFRLVQINGTLPSAYNGFFNGWDRSGIQPTNEVAIHHPGGANKKITFDNNPATHSDGFGGRLPNGFWQVIWDLGMTEGGSSGCPLYDHNKRVIGQNLGGIPSQCENPQAVWKVFGKFSESWAYGGSPSNQLKSWLDPNNTNIMTLDGIDAVIGSAPITNFTADTQYLPIGGGNINFFDMSTYNPTTWAWSFPGATPSTSNIKNPVNINYTATGSYTVSLTSTNANGSNTRTVVNYIRVAGVPLNAFNLISPPNNTTIQVANNDPTIVKFDWQRSSSSPTVKYMFKLKKFGQPNEYTFTSDNNGADTIISLRKNFLDSIATIMGYIGDSVRCTWKAGATNGLDTLLSNSFLLTLKSLTIGISQIGTEIPDKFVLYNNYPNPFNPNTVIVFDVAQTALVKVKVYDITGREIKTLVSQNLTAGKYKVDFIASNLSSGVYFYVLESDKFYQVKKMVLIK